ncbi:MAG TPA: type VI secretion system protein TssA [Planctomycetes bacterium]|nr:type VI secretion system protein TssA [Planctomycetota bacterium]
MSKYDIESLFSEVSADNPCGEDISYDQDYLALERLLQPKGEGVIAADEEAAEEPNWSEVADKSFNLLRRSKDLRVVMYFTVALLKLEGFAGLRDGLYLLRGLLERFWDNMYPQLDPEDNNDPLERINILSALSPGTVSEQDPMKFRQRAMEVPLCDSRQMGRFSFRDIQVAKGAITVSDEQRAQVPEMSVIDAAFRDSEIEKLQSAFEEIEGAIEHVSAVTDVFSERAYQSQSPDLSDFVMLLKNIRKCLGEHLGVEAAGAAGAAGGDEDEGVVPAAGVSGGGPISGSIQSPQDAIKLMEKICEYFERYEPSSPVPLLLRRAKKLVSKNFIEIIENMCPGAMSEVETVKGPEPDSGTA